MKAVAIIPARYGSTRFSGKPLAMIGDKPMIQRVYEQVAQVKMIDEIWVAKSDGGRMLPLNRLEIVLKNILKVWTNLQ